MYHAEAAALKSSHSYDITNSFDDNLIVIYNRVPKTGSTSFINLAYDLCKKNHFYVLHINITANMHVLSLNNQVSSKQKHQPFTYLLLYIFMIIMSIFINKNFVYIFFSLILHFQISFARNISAWNEMKPALYHGHMAYLDFSK